MKVNIFKKSKSELFKQWILSLVVVRYLHSNYTAFRRKHCKHEKGKWLDYHCGVSFYECKKCGESLMYW